MNKSFISILFLLLLTDPRDVLCQTGAIRGVVEDATSKQRLPGTNVVIKGTFLGTVTDTSGGFRITGIRIGTYSITASLVGYASLLIPDVRIGSDSVVDVEIQLTSHAIETEQVVVTANRREQSSHEVPVSISTVSAKALSLREPTTLDDALRYVPGVNMTYDQINIRGSSGYSRGVGTRVLLLFDGLPYLTGDTGEITWETLPMYQIGRIEVVKGAGSALYGSNALGGVINIITKDIPDKPEVGFRLYSGVYSNPGFSEWNWSSSPRFNSGGYLSYSDKLDSFRYLLSVTRSVDESYRENDTYHRWNFYVKTRYDFSPVQRLDIMGNFMNRTHGNFFWWNSLSEATRPADAQRNGNVEWNRGNLSVSYKQFISDKLFYTVKGTYYGNFWRDDSSGRVNNVSASHLFYSETQATYSYSDANTLTLGVTANYDRVRSNLFGAHPGAGFAFFAQDELLLTTGLTLTAGVRYDWQKVSILNSASQLNPKGGLAFSPDGETTFRASFGTGFRYPAISELYTDVNTGVSQLNIIPNPNLRAESSSSYEVGFSHSFADLFVMDCAAFENDFKDLIEPSVDTTAHPVAIHFANVTRARIRGFEIGFKANIVEKTLLADLGYTYVDARDLSNDEVLKFRPRHILYGSVQWNFEHANLLVDYRHVSRVEAIDENLVRFGPIVDGDQRVPINVVDFRFFYDLGGVQLPVRFGLNITNVFNYHYVELMGNLAPVRLMTFSIDGIL